MLDNDEFYDALIVGASKEGVEAAKYLAGKAKTSA